MPIRVNVKEKNAAINFPDGTDEATIREAIFKQWPDLRPATALPPATVGPSSEPTFDFAETGTRTAGPGETIQPPTPEPELPRRFAQTMPAMSVGEAFATPVATVTPEAARAFTGLAGNIPGPVGQGVREFAAEVITSTLSPIGAGLTAVGGGIAGKAGQAIAAPLFAKMGAEAIGAGVAKTIFEPSGVEKTKGILGTGMGAAMAGVPAIAAVKGAATTRAALRSTVEEFAGLKTTLGGKLTVEPRPALEKPTVPTTAPAEPPPAAPAPSAKPAPLTPQEQLDARRALTDELGLDVAETVEEAAQRISPEPPSTPPEPTPEVQPITSAGGRDVNAPTPAGGPILATAFRRRDTIRLEFDISKDVPSTADIERIFKDRGHDVSVEMFEPNEVSIAAGRVKFQIIGRSKEGHHSEAEAKKAYADVLGTEKDITTKTAIEQRMDFGERLVTSIRGFQRMRGERPPETAQPKGAANALQQKTTSPVPTVQTQPAKGAGEVPGAKPTVEDAGARPTGEAEAVAATEHRNRSEYERLQEAATAAYDRLGEGNENLVNSVVNKSPLKEWAENDGASEFEPANLSKEVDSAIAKFAELKPPQPEAKAVTATVEDFVSRLTEEGYAETSPLGKNLRDKWVQAVQEAESGELPVEQLKKDINNARVTIDRKANSLTIHSEGYDANSQLAVENVTLSFSDDGALRMFASSGKVPRLLEFSVSKALDLLRGKPSQVTAEPAKLARPAPQPEAEAVTPSAIAKEPWQMTKAEWRRHEQRGTWADFTDESLTQARTAEKAAYAAIKTAEDTRKALGQVESIRKIMTDREGALRRNQARRDADKTIQEARDDFSRASRRVSVRQTHEAFIKRALERGEVVPPEILADYPELKPAEAAPAKAEPTPSPIPEPIPLTFQQFLEAPREGKLLAALKTLKLEKTPEQLAAIERDNRATEALAKAKLEWIYDRSDPFKQKMVEAQIRGLSKAKKKLVAEYEASLDETARVSGSTEAGQRRLYDRAVEAGIIKDPSKADIPSAREMPPGPGALSPIELVQRSRASNPPTPPPESAYPIAVEGTPDYTVTRNVRDWTIVNRANSGQWTFHFGRLGQFAKAAWDKMALGEFELRSSIAKDIHNLVSEPVRQLPLTMKWRGAKAFYEVLDGRTIESIEAEWAGKRHGEKIIALARGVKTRLEEMRVLMRDTLRDLDRSAFNSLDKETLTDLFKRNISDTADISGMTKSSLADALVTSQYPDTWGIADGSYLPHMFFGQWVVKATMPGAEKSTFVVRARTSAEAKARMFELAKKNPELAGATFEIEMAATIPADMLRLGDKQFWKMIQQMKERELADTIPEIRDAVRGIIGRKASRQKWFGSRMHREGHPNYSHDYEQTMTAYISGFHRWRVLSKLNRDVQPLIEKVKAEGRPQAARRLEELMDNLWGKPAQMTLEFDNFLARLPKIQDWVMPLALDRWSRNARSLVVAATLWTPRFAILNRLQPLQGLYPLVGERLLTKAKVMQHTRNGRALLESAGVTFDPGQYAEPGVVGRLGSDLRERLTGEASNQELAFLAMYLHGMERGLPHAEAVNYGKLRGQLMTQFTPLVVDTPPLLEGPVGATVFQYRRFSIKQLELQARLVMDRNAPGIVRLLAAFGAMGGIALALRQGWIAKEKQLEIRRNLEKAVGKDTAKVLFYGLPGYMGADMSGSFVLMDEPFGDTIYEKLGRTITGPGASLAIETGKALFTPTREPTTTAESTRDLLQRFPTTKPLAQLWALAESDPDVRTPDGEVKYRRSLTDALAGLGSFRGVDEANQTLAKNGIMELNKEGRALKNAYYVALQEGDVTAATQKIVEFNLRWPEVAITKRELNNYVEYRKGQRDKTDIERAAGEKFKVLLPQP